MANLTGILFAPHLNMRCWACARTIGLYEDVCELPVAAALVHRACYKRETGQEPDPWAVESLAKYIARGQRPAA
jgi:hypothetical protein